LKDLRWTLLILVCLSYSISYPYTNCGLLALCGRTMLQNSFSLTRIGKKVVMSLLCLTTARSKKKVLSFVFQFSDCLETIWILFYSTLRTFNCVHVGRFPLSVSNTYSFTKLFINENIAEINLFRERYLIITTLLLIKYNIYIQMQL